MNSNFIFSNFSHFNNHFLSNIIVNQNQQQFKMNFRNAFTNCKFENKRYGIALKPIIPFSININEDNCFDKNSEKNKYSEINNSIFMEEENEYDTFDKYSNHTKVSEIESNFEKSKINFSINEKEREFERTAYFEKENEKEFYRNPFIRNETYCEENSENEKKSFDKEESISKEMEVKSDDDFEMDEESESFPDLDDIEKDKEEIYDDEEENEEEGEEGGEEEEDEEENEEEDYDDDDKISIKKTIFEYKNKGDIFLSKNETKIIKKDKKENKKNNEPINKLFSELNEEGLSKGINNIYLKSAKKKLIGKRILKTNENLNKDQRKWIKVYHGTKFENIKSILKNGLKKPGEFMDNNKKVKPRKGHINFGQTFFNIKNWAKAIFVSPSIFYSSCISYSERIESEGEKWCIVIEAKIRPNSYKAYGSTIENYRFLKNEPRDIEYRIENKKDIYIYSILFIKERFIIEAKNYLDGDIFNIFN